MTDTSQTKKENQDVSSEHWMVDALRRMKRNRASVVGAVVVAVLVMMAIFGPYLVLHPPNETDTPRRLEGPSSDYPFGTDELGRCTFSRILAGARISFLMGFISVSFALVLGTILGILAGFYPALDNWIMRCVDVMMAFPAFLLAIAIVAALGPGMESTMAAVGISSVPLFVRMTRSEVLSYREQDFIEATRAVGARDARIMFRHILPNMLSSVVVFATLRLSIAILFAASLSFLGLGAQPPTPEWGAMVSTAREYLTRHPLMAFWPSLMIFIMVLAFNFLGDGLRDALDPRQSDS